MGVFEVVGAGHAREMAINRSNHAREIAITILVESKVKGMLKMAYPLNGHGNLRKGRFSEPNRIYLITATTYQRGRIFEDWNVATAAIHGFLQPDLLKDAQLLCWVLMPDHAHWLISLGEKHGLSTLVGMMKSASARFVHQTGFSEKVWGEAFHDRVLRQEEDLRAAARYIVANPLRAGLVEKIGRYPYWDAVYLYGHDN